MDWARNTGCGSLPPPASRQPIKVVPPWNRRGGQNGRLPRCFPSARKQGRQLGDAVQQVSPPPPPGARPAVCPPVRTPAMIPAPDRLADRMPLSVPPANAASRDVGHAEPEHGGQHQVRPRVSPRHVFRLSTRSTRRHQPSVSSTKPTRLRDRPVIRQRRAPAALISLIACFRAGHRRQAGPVDG